MNKLNIASTGYPGTTESWKFIKDAYEMIADVLGKVIDINDAVILSGMEVTGNDISDGYLSYNGEIYAFKGGEFTGTIVLVEDVTNVEYNTDPADSGQLQSLPTYYKRYARNGQAGDGFKDIAYDDFVRLDSLIDISERTKQATETKKGIAEIATQSETNTGTDDEKIVTPKKLATRTATESRTGIAAIATQQEVDDGQDDTKIVTPKKLNSFWTSGIEKQIVDITSTGLTEIYLNIQISNADYIIAGSLHNSLLTFYRYNIRDKHPDKFIIDVQSTDGSTGNINTKFEFMVMRL